MKQAAIERLYEQYAMDLGVEISMGTVQSLGYIWISADNEVHMKLAYQDNVLSYIEYPDYARRLRLDAPLVRLLLDDNKKSGLIVEVPLCEPSPQAPKSLVTMSTRLRPHPTEVRSESSVFSIPTRDGSMHYDFEGLVGLEDFLGAARDALLLAEAADPAQCMGPHGLEFTGSPRATPSQVSDALLLRRPICARCLTTMNYMGMPVAPKAPRGWT